ncbi:unnamed protein product (macronuclear) [Paramecium tetraurelia]|uniref:Uncharacterized protein n=1 Tax=Paramecium tetraurelia TaxID=5888 RepID=A0C710_PARTE|nr:uncharacterized protein GSPATT00035706001 [Paramecium tetraurelia]CAK66577.1 unnamed protein product [Paramecium tetraurelia]|eukprot:XP_001433974.1 hypothetical protein (macronuclear) [Paramecium tetraurelia strain d4-2]
MKYRYIQSLTELQNKVLQYFQKQEKVITTLIEQQNHQISLNISQANTLLTKQSVLDSQSIDNFIIFITLNNAKQQIIENQYNQINNYLERQFNYEFAEIQCKVNQLTTMDIKFNNVPKFEEEQFKIETVEKINDQLPFCKDHQMEKNCICIHQDCLKEQNLQYTCIQCAESNHQEHHKGNYVKTLKKLKQEQVEKIKLIEENLKMLKVEVENRIDKVLKENQEQHQENFIQSQIQRENLKLLEAFTVNDHLKQNSKYIYKKIDQNLLQYDSDMIQQEFQFQLNTFEQLKQQNTTIKKKEFLKLYQSIENVTLNYKQETFKLKNQVQQYEIQISELQKKLEAQSNESLLIKLKQIICEGQNQIQQQIEATPKIVVESMQFKFLQQDMKHAIIKINEIKQQTDAVHQFVVSLKEDMKNIIIQINKIQQQTEAVPQFVVSLQEDMKYNIIKIKEIHQQTEAIPQFVSLKQDIKHSRTTINQIHLSTQTLVKQNIEVTSLLPGLANMIKSTQMISEQIQVVPKIDAQNTQFTQLQKQINEQIMQLKQQIQYIPNCYNQTLSNQVNLLNGLIRQVHNIGLILEKNGDNQNQSGYKLYQSPTYGGK